MHQQTHEQRLWDLNRETEANYSVILFMERPVANKIPLVLSICINPYLPLYRVNLPIWSSSTKKSTPSRGCSHRIHLSQPDCKGTHVASSADVPLLYSTSLCTLHLLCCGSSRQQPNMAKKGTPRACPLQRSPLAPLPLRSACESATSRALPSQCPYETQCLSPPADPIQPEQSSPASSTCASSPWP